jgi:hypothetical protein
MVYMEYIFNTFDKSVVSVISTSQGHIHKYENLKHLKNDNVQFIIQTNNCTTYTLIMFYTRIS